MRDLRDQIDGVWRAASRLSSGAGGTCVMFIAANEGEGTSSIAASFALLAARKSQKSAWLLDLDLRRNAVFAAATVGREPQPQRSCQQLPCPAGARRATGQRLSPRSAHACSAVPDASAAANGGGVE